MRLFDRFLGRGAGSVTVPVMDGPFLPNQKLEQAEFVCAAPDADNLMLVDRHLLATSGDRLLRLTASVSGETFECVQRFERRIASAASNGEAIAIGLDGGGVLVQGGAFDGARLGDKEPSLLRCPTALAWLDDSTLAVCNGSAWLEARQWRRDLMETGASGSVWMIDLRKASLAKIADGLGWPAGVALSPGGGLYVAESWRHRILLMGVSREGVSTELSNLPAYPARLTRSAKGGYWMTFYSARNQLVEFILQEDGYRRRMLAEVPEPYWMAPALGSGSSFKEPMQGSQLKQMGVLKPYAASRSYGLVAYCSADMKPLGAFHSRADGRRHGAISACEHGGVLYVASRGASAVVRVSDAVKSVLE